MIKIKGNQELENRYPDTRQNQCKVLKARCSSCGAGFGAGLNLKCQVCGDPRMRCGNAAMNNEDVCRIHARGRAYSLYNKLAAVVSDAALEEFIEKDNKDLTQEFALARMALSGILEEHSLTSKELLENTKLFFDIALKKKRIEDGDVLNIQWNDELANSMRKRWRQVINSIGDILRTSLKDEYIKEGVEKEVILKDIFFKLQESIKILGNHLTAIPVAEQVKKINAKQL